MSRINELFEGKDLQNNYFRFDEILNEKASKVLLDTLIDTTHKCERMLEIYSNQMKINDINFQKVHQKVETIQKKMKNLDSTVTKEIETSIRKRVDQMKYDLSTNATNSLSELLNIKENLDRKANTEEVLAMLSFK